ncbi:MAG: MgtC/SapB family protein [Gemmatimonadota bacterium]|nr:MgtC/SapB family protein [Gemmatimonadota bacterium]
MNSVRAWSFDFYLAGEVLLRALIAYALTLPIGRERAQDDTSAGLRTFPLVAVAACSYVLLAQSVLGINGNGHQQVLQGLVTGIGFIGGGAILKSADRVRGTATAASIWATSIIGAAVGYGHLEIAVVLAILTFLTLRIVTRIERAAEERAARATAGAAHAREAPSRRDCAD